MKNLTLFTFLLLMYCSSHAQDEKKQEFGINAAGLFVKNQATVAPSFIYRYKINDFQLRVQLAYDSRITNENRNGFFKQQQTTFLTTRDTVFTYEPAKNNTIGFMFGFQKNQTINNSAFKYFYGIDFIYMYKDFKRSGSGTGSTISGSTNQTFTIKTVSQNKLKTMGVGVPLGISYFWDEKFYASIEAKFVVAYQENNIKISTENFTQTTPTQSFTINTGSNTTTYGFDVGIKPITGLCFGIVF
ncbi:MAG: hypothetical protein ACKVQB_07195 [Bacteroidia bacterium]